MMHEKFSREASFAISFVILESLAHANTSPGLGLTFIHPVRAIIPAASRSITHENLIFD
jgi:hypothetical protein